MRDLVREHGEKLWHDVRYTLRTLRKNPTFTAIAVLTLALGIGANTAIFTVVHAVLLRPLPFRDDARLVRIYQVRDRRPPYISLRPQTYLELVERGRFFDHIVAQRFANLTLFTPEGPERVVGISVTEAWLDTLGVEPILGRGFLPEEYRASEDSGVTVISHSFWQRRMGGDPNVLGRTVQLDSGSYQIVGVLPPGYRYPYESELWVPLRLDRDAVWGLNVQARLKPGVSLEQARADLDTINRHLAQEFPEVHRGTELLPIPLREALLDRQDNVLLALLAAVGFVLLMVCANLANLLLARSISRQREMAIRTALGASRVRQVRQLLTESFVLSVIGGVAGLGLAVWGNRFLSTLVPPALLTLIPEIPLEWPVLLFAASATLLTGMLFGLVPALRASRTDLQAALKESGRTSGTQGSHRLQGVLVVSEVALALVLLTGAGLMIRNFERLTHADLGYEPRNLLTMTVALPPGGYADAAARTQFVRQAEEQLRGQPGVRAVGVTTLFPMRDGNFLAGIEIQGRPLEPNQRPIVNHRMVTPGFLPALRVPLLRGRFLSDTDREDTEPVVVISQSLARRYFPGEDPLGQRMRNVRSGSNSPWMRVVGVVGDVREFYDVRETWYVPYVQDAASSFANQVIFTVRTPLGGDAVAGLRRAVWNVDPTLPLFRISTVETRYADAIAQQRFSALLLAFFAGFGLLLAALGTYGVMAYAVSQRTHEVAIRIALGATPGHVLRVVLKRGVALVLLGLSLGMVTAVALSRLLAGVLSEISASDPWTYAAVAVVLAAVALAACYIPARRATRVDPMTALRES